MNVSFPWKKNVFAVSTNILATVRGFKTHDCVAACVQRVRFSDLQRGRFAHLGIVWTDSGLVVPPEALPSAENGRYSKKNVLGYEEVFTDLPKTNKEWSLYTPNFGDWSKGGHDITISKDVYQRATYAPQLLPIRMELLAENVLKTEYTIKFSVGEVLDRQAASFQYHLLFDINLLQENTGNHNVYESGTTSEDYLKTLYVNWEILPPGERDQNITRIMTGLNVTDPKLLAKIVDRYEFLLKLHPRHFVKGANGFHNYFGAQFADDLVVFENIEYGNAVYVMFEEWAQLSKLSRTELLTSHLDHIVRIPHTKSWKGRVSHEVAKYLHKRR